MAVQSSLAGDRVTERRFGPLRFDDTRYPSGLNMPRHAHDKPHLSCLVRGSFDEALGSTEHTRMQGAAIFRRSEFEHSCQFHGSPVQILRVEFDDSWLARVESMADAQPRSFVAQTTLTATLTTRLLRELTIGDGASALSAEGLVLELLAEAFRTGTPRDAGEPRWLRRVREALHEGFLQQLSLSELAADAGVHPSYLARTFRARHGCTIGAYLRRLRVDYAADRLRNTDVPLAEIAQAAGYADQGHFTRQFRRATGRTPGEYRRQADR